jgi:hypothetical protein
MFIFKKFIVFLIVFFANIHFALNKTVLTQDIYKNLIDETFNLCLKDQDCRSDFEQVEHQNITIFEYFARQLILSKTKDVTTQCYNYYDDDVFCSQLFKMTQPENKLGLFTEPMLVSSWLLQLILFKRKQQVCDINHHLVIDPITLKGDCVCNFETLCDSTNVDHQISLAIIIIIAIFLFLTLLINIYKVSRLIPVVNDFFRHISKKPKFVKSGHGKITEERKSEATNADAQFKLVFIQKILKVLLESI